METYKIKEARKAQGVTQEQLASQIGINRATLSRYESGAIDPPASQLSKIADALGVPVSDLYGAKIDFAQVAAEPPPAADDEAKQRRIKELMEKLERDPPRRSGGGKAFHMDALTPEEIELRELLGFDLGDGDTAAFTPGVISSGKSSTINALLQERLLDKLEPIPPLPEHRIAAALDKLNDKGQRVAAERVEELTQIPDYQKPPKP